MISAALFRSGTLSIVVYATLLVFAVAVPVLNLMVPARPRFMFQRIS